MQPSVEIHREVVRRVFPSWSIVIPTSFEETFVADDEYWHARDGDRSVSLSSFVLEDDHGPVEAGRLARQVPPPDGAPVQPPPAGLPGWIIEVEVEEDRAARCLSGMLFADGRALAVTVTGHDIAWVQRTLSSIRLHPAGRRSGPGSVTASPPDAPSRHRLPRSVRGSRRRRARR